MSNIKRSGGGDDIGSISTDNTNGVKNSKDAETDDLETGMSNGGGVASVEESSSSTSSVAAAAADEINNDNKEQTNKIKDKDIKEDINCNCDHDDIMDNKKSYARTDKNTDNNKKNNSEDNNDIEAGNNMLIASGQKTKKGSTSSSIDDHPTPNDDNFPSSSLPPSSLILSSSGINSINQTRSAATSSKIIRRSQSEVGAFAIDSPFSSSSNNNNNHDQDTTTITSAMMTDGVYNASVSLVGSSTTIPTNTDTNLNSQLSSGGGSYGSSHFIVEAVRVDDDCVVVASIVENNNNNNNNTSSNNSINSSSCGQTKRDKTRICTCLPYKDGFMITAQIMSIIAFGISWMWWVTLAVGLVSLVFIQLAWCCRQSKIVLFVSVGISTLAGIACTIAGIVMIVLWKDKVSCHYIFFITDVVTDVDDVFDFFEESSEYYEYPESRRDYCYERTWAVVAFVTATLWFTTSGLILYFVGSGRYAIWEEKEKLRGASDTTPTTTTATPTAIEMGAV